MEEGSGDAASCGTQECSTLSPPVKVRPRSDEPQRPRAAAIGALSPYHPRPMWSPALTLLVPIALLLAPLAAQRPKTAEEALAKFARVADRPESERFRPVGDLGDFADDLVTQRLLAELQAAKSPAYRQAVIRAIGEQTRSDAVPPLAQELQAAGNVRMVEAIATALAKQGDAGVRVLAQALGQEKAGSAKVHALCDGLGRATADSARDALLAALQQAGGRDRLPPLRGLRRWHADPLVDSQRELLARHKDAPVAATALQQLAEHQHSAAPTLAAELSRRAGPTAGTDVHTAVLLGLLLQPTAEHFESLLVAGAHAEDPFAKARRPAWETALGDAAFVRWLADAGTTRKPAGERAFAATALGLCPAAHHAVALPALQRALGQKEPEVVRAAAMALSELGGDGATTALAKLLATGAEPLQPIALAALHHRRGKDDAWRTELLQHANGKGAPLRAAALQLLATTQAGADQEALVAAAAGNLTHKAWVVRAAAIDLLRALRAPAGVPLLFERLEQEQGRLQKDVTAALQDLTALQFPTTEAWRNWWQKEGATFRVVAKKQPNDERGDRRGDAKPTTASYWNLPVTSDRIVFVVDTSGSMTQPFGTGDDTRLDEAKRQLVRVLGLMPGKAKANVVVFSDEAKAFAEALQSLDERKKKAAEGFTQALTARGSTNVHAGLRAAFADAEVDTIFLLTDGQPSSGPIVDQDALLREVAAWNLGRNVRIHTVAIGGRSRFLEQLAAQSGGEHTVAR